MDLKASLEQIFEWGSNQNDVVNVFENDSTVFKLVNPGGGNTKEVMEFNKPINTYSHNFLDIESFVDFMETRQNEEIVVFVSEDRVEAEIGYGGHHIDKAYMQLTRSPEFNALRKLMAGIGRKALWELLVGDLHECIPEELLIRIGTINMRTVQKYESEINIIGLENGGSSEMMGLQFKGQNGEPVGNEKLETNWTYNGTIYSQRPSDLKYRIDLRLVLYKEDGLMFKFIPRRLDIVLNQARNDVVDELKFKLPAVQVYQGKL